MTYAPTPEDLIGSTSDEPLVLELLCTPCGARAKLSVPWVSVNPKVMADPQRTWDGVSPARIFTCAKCGAVDQYELSSACRSRILGNALGRALGAPTDPRILIGVSVLWDGTEARRPTQALQHLRAVAERRPTSAEAWRRVGNACERYEQQQEALAAWRRAVEASPDEFEAALSLADAARHPTSQEEASEFLGNLQLAVARIPRATEYDAERRREFADAIAELLLILVEQCDFPVVLLASWRDGKAGTTVVMNHASVDLRALERRDTLGEFLARPELVSLDLTSERDGGEPTFLQKALEQPHLGSLFHTDANPLSDRSTRSQPVRAAPRPGRNEPCTCGSGKKYKKCHGR